MSVRDRLQLLEELHISGLNWQRNIFTRMFIQQFRKYVSRHIEPMSDAKVLMGLVLLHFGPFHKHIN